MKNKKSDKSGIMTAEVKACSSAFDDLLKVSDRAIQRMLNVTDHMIIQKALQGASEELKDKIFGNMSKTAETMLREDMCYMESLTPEEIEEARASVCYNIFIQGGILHE